MAKKKKGGKGFLNAGLGWVIDLILIIIGVGLILGCITRIMRGNILGAILNIIIFPLFYVVDIITIIVKHDITFLA